MGLNLIDDIKSITDLKEIPTKSFSKFTILEGL